jgi:hypothetical protein
LPNELTVIRRELRAAASEPGGAHAIARIRVTSSAYVGSIVRIALPPTSPGVVSLSELHIHPDDWLKACEQADREPHSWHGSINRDLLYGVSVIVGDEA